MAPEEPERGRGEAGGLTGALLEHLQAGVVSADRAGRVSFANRSALGILGLKPGDCLGRELPSIFGNPRELVESLEGLEAGSSARLEFPVELSGGRIEIGMTCFQPRPGGLDDLCTVAVFRELAGRRQFEAEVRRVERLAALGDVVAGFAHEVRNPVAAIQGLAENLLSEMHEDDRRRELVTRVLAALGQIERFVAASLEYGAPRPPRRSRQRPAELAAAAIHNLARRLETRCRPELVLAADLPDVDVDADHVVEALAGLLDNALDATGDPGAVRLTVRPAREEEVLDDRGGHVCFEVADDGPGIPEESLSRVFDPFYTTRIAGTGLGLAIVQTLARQNDGRVLLSSRPGEGTRAKLLLPRVS